MTARKPSAPRSCPECRYTGSWHYSEDGSQSWRCPNYAAAEQAKVAEAIIAEASDEAKQEARRIVADAARRYYEFSSRQIREELDAAQIPGSAVGPAFLWAASEAASEDGPLIVKTERKVPSDQQTTRHGLYVWRSLVHPQARREAS